MSEGDECCGGRLSKKTELGAQQMLCGEVSLWAPGSRGVLELLSVFDNGKEASVEMTE